MPCRCLRTSRTGAIALKLKETLKIFARRGLRRSEVRIGSIVHSLSRQKRGGQHEAKTDLHNDMIHIIARSQVMIKPILALVATLWLAEGPAAAQQAAATKNWTPPKTPWGEPDLQGMWPLNHLIATPFQRPAKYGDRRFMTDEEFAAAQKSAQARNQRFESGAIPQADSGTQVLRLTSLLSDPPDGRFPALTPKGKQLNDKMHGSYKPGQTVFDSPDDFDSWDRCITRGMPVSMLPRNYNNGIQIMQSPGYVLIVL